jgi:hypothetical protein
MRSTAPFLQKTAIAAAAGASLVGFQGAGSTVTTVQDAMRGREISVREFGAVGDNVTNDTAAFQAAFNYCAANKRTLYIPYGLYVLNLRVSTTQAFDIRCDHTARLRWLAGSVSQGFFFDFDASVGLCTIDLPQLYGSAVDSNFNIPGYVSGNYTYDLASRVGTGIRLRGGDRTNINVQTAQGFYSVFYVEPGPTRSTNNVNLTINTADFVQRAVWADCGTWADRGINALVFTANTVWAKNPIFIDANTGFMTSSQFNITGQTFVNETAGVGVYGSGLRIDTTTFNINWLMAGYAVDSTAGTDPNLQVPYIAGNGTSNGVSNDGNGTMGYFRGKFCEFNIGAVMGIPGGKGAGSVPVAGDLIRVRDAGGFNKVRIAYSDRVAVAPIPLATVRGEANYNGGVGGAPYSRRVYCKVTLPQLFPLNGSQTFYAYHQLLSPGSFRNVRVVPNDEGLNNQGLLASAKDLSGVNNREIAIVFNNPSDTRTTAAGDYFFWLEVD